MASVTDREASYPPEQKDTDGKNRKHRSVESERHVHSHLMPGVGYVLVDECKIRGFSMNPFKLTHCRAPVAVLHVRQSDAEPQIRVARKTLETTKK